jgi:hypothetical protein
VFLNQSGKATVWRLISGKWQQTPRLQGAAFEIQVSANGSVWVASTFHAGLSRWDRDHWTWFKGEDFGTQTNYTSGGFALASEEVWGATQEAVVHWDGAKWHRLPIHGEPESIVAAGDEAWTITSTGTLTHYTANRESATDLRGSIPANWVKRVSTRPVLGRTTDGTLWLVWDGVWRQQGEEWRAANLPRDSRLLRSQGDSVWFWTGKSLVALDGNGTQAKTYAPDEPSVLDVAAAGDSVWIAGQRGVRQIAGADRSIELLPPNAAVVPRLAISPDGVLWAVAQMRGGTAYLSIAGVVLVTILFVALTLWAMQAVLTSPSVSPLGLPRGSPPPLPSLRKIILVLTAGVAAMLVLVFLLQQIIAKFPAKPASAFVWGYVIAVLLWIAIGVSKGKQTIARATGSALAWLAFLLTLQFGLDWFFKAFRNPGIAVIIIFVLVPFLGLLIGLAVEWPLRWVNAKLRRGDYVSALWRVDALLPWWPKAAGLRYVRGTVLLFAGRSQEAESDLRESSASGSGKGTKPQAIALSNLGYALLDQERYAEASQSFEQSNTMTPASGSAFNGLAEVLLRQDQQPFEALRNLDRAIELKRGWRKTDRHMLAYMWANRAWALGNLGRTEEALAALQDAEKENTPNFVPGFAGAHWRMGMALIAMDRRAEALEHFRRANEADPHGNYGNRAAKAMRDFGS